MMEKITGTNTTLECRRFPYRIGEMDLEEGGEPGGAGCADNGHAHQVSDHARGPQQLHPVHAPDQTRS